MKTQPDNHDLLACAVDAVKAAGGHAHTNANRRRETVLTLDNDVKLRLDVECQEKAESVIASRFPQHAILGEEDDTLAKAGEAKAHDRSQNTDAGYEWIIDPIDGTVNFSHGLRRWCSSVAVRKGHTVVAGAVYAPALGELFTATADGSAQLNGQTIHVCETDTLSESIVLTGTNKVGTDGDHSRYTLFERIADAVRRPRITGSATLDICDVAAGRAEAYFEWGIYIWDVAAAGLFVEQAGGQTEVLGTFEGHGLRFLATNGRIHAALKALILP